MSRRGKIGGVRTVASWVGAALLVVAPGRAGEASGPAGAAQTPLHADSLSIQAARPGDRVTLRGEGFGVRAGAVVLTGRRVEPVAWSDTEVAFVVPEDGVSGGVRLRSADGESSDPIGFTVERPLPAGQVASHGLRLEDTGLPGAAFLVETDGTCLFGVSGFETLCTYELRDNGPHVFRGRTHLNQRVADLRVRGGYLFCLGDHGLIVYRCADLRAGRAEVVAAVAGAS